MMSTFPLLCNIEQEYLTRKVRQGKVIQIWEEIIRICAFEDNMIWYIENLVKHTHTQRERERKQISKQFQGPRSMQNQVMSMYNS
jgi:hypothetical protein